MSKTDNSILTDAMLLAQEADQETDNVEESNETIVITFNKKALKKVLFGTVAAAAVTYVATRLLSSSDEDSEEPSED